LAAAVTSSSSRRTAKFCTLKLYTVCANVLPVLLPRPQEHKHGSLH
jgi:hypothetical protein